jgi:drug/metabolite transporter (DMT)-like permease
MGLELATLIAFGAMLCWGIGDFLIQRTTRKIGDVETLAWIGIIGSIGLLPFVIQEFSLIRTWGQAGVLALLGAITFGAALANFEALKKGKLSVIEIVMTLELPITILLAVLLFQERLTISQTLAAGVVFLGVVLIASESFSYVKGLLKGLEKGVVLAFFGACGMGIINFLTGTSAKAVSPLLAIWVPWVIFTIICVAVIEMRRGGVRNFVWHWRHHRWLIVAMGIFDTLAWLFYAFAVEGNEIALTIAITESYPAVALFLGLWLNKEKISWHQYCGAALALGASFWLGFAA